MSIEGVIMNLRKIFLEVCLCSIPPNLTHADAQEFIFDIYPIFHSEGPIDTWVNGAYFCESPEDLVTNWVSDVIALNLQTGISNSLDSKLQAVFDSLDEIKGNNTKSAKNRLGAFVNEVEAQRGTEISESDADFLVDAVSQILEMIDLIE